MAVVFVDQITPAGPQTGLNQVFTLPNAPNPPASLKLWYNGTLQDQGVDYTLVGSTITYTFIFPVATDVQLASFRYNSTPPPPTPTPSTNQYPLLTFSQLYQELKGEIPPLPDMMAQRIINRAWKRINDYRMWSYQIVSNGQLFVPTVITAGSATVTFNSTQVIMDAAATSALNAVAFGNPPLASPVLGVGYQIRLGSGANGLNVPIGPNYSITAWDGLGNMTIDSPYGQSSQTGLNYQVLKCFYAAPFLPVTSTGPDGQFARFMSVTNLLNGYTITGRQLYFSQEELNRIDPQRGGQGDAYILSLLQTNTLGQPVYEMYPNPVNPATYQANFMTKPPLLTMTTQLPQVSFALDDTVTFLAKAFAGEWALANSGNPEYPMLRQVNWIQYVQMMKEEWRQSMLLCIKEDDEIMPSPKPFVYNGAFTFPLGGEFLQQHDLSSIIPAI